MKRIFSGLQLYLQENKRISLRIVGNKFDAWTGNISDKWSEGRPRNNNQNITYFSIHNKIHMINQSASILTSLSKNSVLEFGSNEHHEILPYFDAQDIDLDFPAALSGIEFFHYYTPGYGGFVRPRITTINYYDAILDVVEKIDIQGPNFYPIKSGFKNNLELIYLGTKLP